MATARVEGGELAVPVKRRTPAGKLLTLGRAARVSMTLLEDGETVEIYAEHSMVLAPISGNVIHLKLRQIAEVE